MRGFSVLGWTPGRRAQLLRHPARPAGRELDARVARVAGDEHLTADDSVTFLLQFFIREAGGAEPLDATNLEVGEEVGVVDYPSCVGLGVADAEFRLVD